MDFSTSIRFVLNILLYDGDEEIWLLLVLCLHFYRVHLF